METRRLIVAFFAAMAAFYLWTIVASYIWPPKPATTQPVASAPAETQPNGAATRPAVASASTQPAVGNTQNATTLPANIRLVEGTKTDQIHLGDADKNGPFPMAIEIEPRGATIADVKIRGHYETVEKKHPYTIIEPVTTTDNTRLYAFGTAKIRFDNLKLDVPLDSATWTLHADPNGEDVTGTIEIQTTPGKPLARITKRYHLPRQPPGSPRFDLDVSIHVENLTGEPQRIILVQQGPLGFKREDLRSEDRIVVGAMWKGDQVTPKGHTRSDVAKQSAAGTGIKLGGDTEDARIAWAAEVNRYFTCIMTPAGRTGPQDPARFSEVEALDSAESGEPSANTEFSAMTFQYVTTPRDIKAGGSDTIAFNCYIGPKSKNGFQEVPEYAKLDYYAVIRYGFYACAPAALVSVMMKLLDLFHAIPPHNYGVAIIILVLVVRLILHPITKKSQVNMMKMQKQQAALAPKLEALKKKYANDKVQYNQEMMKVYKEAGVNPAGSLLTCLPLMLQIPIWGALWTALGSTIAMRHAPFDPYWIKDLTAPDALIHFTHAIWVPGVSRLMGGPFTSLNVLPILLGISQFLQTKYMPRGTPTKQTGGAPDQLEQQRKMMMFMSVFFVLMLYNAPSGLNLYIMASNFFGILEQWRIRQHIKEEEERMSRQQPPDEPGGSGSNGDPLTRRPPSRPGPPAAPKKETWFQRKWRELEKQADEAHRQQSQRDKRGKGR